MTRRGWLQSAGVALLGGAAALASRGRAVAAGVFRVTHTNDEWRKILSPAAYDVLRQAGTEAPESSPLDHQFAAGKYLCAGCALPLFASDTKFDSGTGWPSFWAPLKDAVDTSSDRSMFMARTEVHCAQCGGHLGHVFDDGAEADRAAVLHERRGAEFCAGGRKSVMRALLIGGVAASALAAFMVLGPARAEDARVMPAPVMDVPAASGTQTVVLSGGCFWGVQGVFEHVKGVQRAVAGYAGGAKATAQYETVSTGDTGHAESVQVTFDPRQISYGKLLQIFFSVAMDPTEVNRQGPDDGTQYRSEVFVHDADQMKVAQAYIAQLDAAHVLDRKIATRVDTLPGFYPAEGYHQDFLENNPNYPYIVVNDMPKVAALKALFPEYYQVRATVSGLRS